MKVGLSAWSFSGLHPQARRGLDPRSLEGLLGLARRHGLAGVEGAPDWFEGMSPSERSLLRRRLEAEGLALYLDTGSDDYAGDLSPLTRALDLAADLGAPVVRTTVSRLLEGDRRALGRRGCQALLESLVEPLKRASAHAERVRVDIGIENHQDFCSRELAWLCGQVGSGRLGVTMDVGNAYAVGETCLDFARGVRPFLKHVHLKDYSVHAAESGYRLVRCALGDGLVDWPSMMDWFEAECPGVQECIELGATTARHIRLLEPDWWETYPDRPFLPGAVEALADLHRAARPPAEEWRTPTRGARRRRSAPPGRWTSSRPPCAFCASWLVPEESEEHLQR